MPPIWKKEKGAMPCFINAETSPAPPTRCGPSGHRQLRRLLGATAIRPHNLRRQGLLVHGAILATSFPTTTTTTTSDCSPPPDASSSSRRGHPLRQVIAGQLLNELRPSAEAIPRCRSSSAAPNLPPSPTGT